MRNGHPSHHRNASRTSRVSQDGGAIGGGGDEVRAAAAEQASDDKPPIRNYRGHHHHINKLFLIAVLSLCFFVSSSLAAAVAQPPSTSYSIAQSGLDSRGGNALTGDGSFSVYKSIFKRQQQAAQPVASTCACSEEATPHDAQWIVEVLLIPVLVILAGIFAGLTLGYMSLDMNQLQVLAKTGTPVQKKQAERIMPLRKNGHLLLVSLLLCNMAASETLPVVSEPVLGGGLQSVIVSTVLVIIFSEIVPQSVCSRFGLQIGAFMVWPTRIVIGVTFIISWPIAKLLEWLLGAHSGVVYRRAELKELIAMHGDTAEHGGDLQRDTVTIVGATLDIQEKVVRDEMTPFDKIFMLDIESRLDYSMLTKIIRSGHSRIPVYEEIEAPLASSAGEGEKKEPAYKKRIIGALLTKQLILLDPEDAVPLRELPLNPFPTVPENMPLLHILNVFQEGRSHMAMVARAPVLPALEPTETRSSESSESSGHFFHRRHNKTRTRSSSIPTNGNERSEEHSPVSPDKEKKGFFRSLRRKDNDAKPGDEEKASPTSASANTAIEATETDVPPNAPAETSLTAMPDPDDLVGLITLEDVLEALIGEEIVDETDPEPLTGRSAAEPYIPAEAKYHLANTSARRGFAFPNPFTKTSGPQSSQQTPAAEATGPLGVGLEQKQQEEKGVGKSGDGTAVTGSSMPKGGPIAAFKRTTLGMGRSASAPGKRRSGNDASTATPNASKGDEALSKKDKSEPAPASTAEGGVKERDYFGLTQNQQTASPAAIDEGSRDVNPTAPPRTETSGTGSADADQPAQTAGPELYVVQDSSGRRRSVDDRQPSPKGKEAQELPERPPQQPRGRTLALAPLLSNALLLEKGRRQLRAQGQDPDALKLRVASSVPATPGVGTGSTTPRYELGAPGSNARGNLLVIAPPGTSAIPSNSSSLAPHGALAPGVRKQSFKMPSPVVDNLPLRAATRPSRSDTPREGETGSDQGVPAAISEVSEASEADPSSAAIVRKTD